MLSFNIMTLAQQIKALRPGESFNTNTTRNGVYVTAKRAGVTVKTETSNGITTVTRIDKPEPRKQITILDQIKELSIESRLELFEHFELCCGMNRGDCVCPAEVISQTMFVGKLETHPENVPQNDVMAFIAKAQAAKGITQPIVAPVEIADEWIFTKDAPQFADDGNVYRQQYLASNPKRKRSVQVDEFDHEKIIS